MPNAAIQKVIDSVEKLVVEGRAFIPQMVNNAIHSQETDTAHFVKWCSSCRNVLRMIGEYAKPFDLHFKQKSGFDRATDGSYMLGSMESLLEELKSDLLVPLESILRADIFSDLLEQAEHLLEEGYFLPAGVLGRAVLEEHLRKWCDRAACVPVDQKNPSQPKPKPTLNDFNVELYKAKHFTLADKTFVDAMAAVGNEAAHNLPTLTKASVDRLLPDVRRFTALHPIP